MSSSEEEVRKLLGHTHIDSDIPLKRKSLFKAYLCWLFGGLFGLHHFYLGRDKHGLITIFTIGGYFTMGLWRDLWRMPEYVKDANNDLEYINWLQTQIRTHERPPSSLVRQSGLLITGNLLAYLVEYGIPKELLHENVVTFLRYLLIPFASAFGVWLAGNVGRHQGSLLKPLIASYFALIPSIIFNVPNVSFTTIAASYTFNKFSKQWRVRPSKPRSTVRRLFVIATFVILYLSLFTSYFYYNCTLEDPETLEPIKCRVAWQNFVKSPAYDNLSELIYMLVEHVRHQGIGGLWREMMQEADVSGKSGALAVLELKDNATPQEILAQYKKLSKEYHPDREKNPAIKAEKHEKFIQVQEAFRKLESYVQRYKLQKEREEEGQVSRDEL